MPAAVKGGIIIVRASDGLEEGIPSPESGFRSRALRKTRITESSVGSLVGIEGAVTRTGIEVLA